MQYNNPKEKIIQKYKQELNKYIIDLNNDIEKIKELSSPIATMNSIIHTIKSVNHESIKMERFEYLLNHDIILATISRLSGELCCGCFDPEQHVNVINSVKPGHNDQSIYIFESDPIYEDKVNQLTGDLDKEQKVKKVIIDATITLL